jgi:hypothetical protein
VAGPTEAALAETAIATQTAPEDEPLRLELRDADQRDAPWELSIHEPAEPEDDSGVIHSADWDGVDDDPGNWAGPV